MFVILIDLFSQEMKMLDSLENKIAIFVDLKSVFMSRNFLHRLSDLILSVKKNLQPEPVLFYSLLLIFLLPVWLNKYFVTGDGPCHLYNAQVLLDFFRGHNLNFYENYYLLNSNPEPNWFSHIVLAGLLYFFPAFLAEKIFITAYVVLFALGLRLLLGVIGKGKIAVSLLGLLFVFHHTMQMGFYNYSFSFVFYFFVVWYWLKNETKFTTKRILVFSLLNVLTFFTHPVGFLLAGLTVGMLIVFNFMVEYFSGTEYRKKSMSNFLKFSGTAFVSFFPSIALMAYYLFRKGMDSFPNPDSFERLRQTLLRLSSLVTLQDSETNWAIAVAVLFGLFLLIGLALKIRRKKIEKQDAFFVVFVIVLLIYFFQPGGMSGAGILSIRLQFVPYLMLVLWFGTLAFHKLIRNFLLVACFVIGAAFTIIRFPHIRAASEAVNEYVSVVQHIDDCSTVAPLSFAHNGKTPDGKLIANQIWLFKHASDYMGAMKSLVLFGNYEGSTGYFPILWKADKNPFMHLSSNEGLEFQPPSVDVLSYDDKTGGSVDYVITWCLDQEWTDHPYTKNLMAQLDQEYQQIFVSENGRAILYRHKK